MKKVCIASMSGIESVCYYRGTTPKLEIRTKAFNGAVHTKKNKVGDFICEIFQEVVKYAAITERVKYTNKNGA